MNMQRLGTVEMAAVLSNYQPQQRWVVVVVVVEEAAAVEVAVAV